MNGSLRETVDLVVVGGGVVGLAVAYEALRSGLQAALVDRRFVGRESSWAGAGIIPPGSQLPLSELPAYERLRAVSFRRFESLAEEILEAVGVDVEFRRTGGVEVARSEEAAGLLAANARARRAHGIRVEEVGAPGLRDLAPGISDATSAIWMPDMRQVRNPRLLAGLASACRQAGARIVEGDGVQRVDRAGGRIEAVCTTSGARIGCRHVVLAAGAWSGNLLASWAGESLPVRPVQGQILAFDAPAGEVATIVLEGKRYLVPRSDGLVLVGATEEDVGFDKHSTPEAVAELRAFATGLFPSLASRPVRYAWAGLRPGSPFGSPLVGRIPPFENLWVATGHFRHGLQLSLGTARLIVDWLAGRESFVAREEFAPGADRIGHQSAFES